MSELLLDILKNEAFDLCLEVLPEDSYPYIFAVKDNDTADTFRDRVLIKVQDSLKKNNSSVFDSPDLKRYLQINSLQDVVIWVAEHQIENKTNYSRLIEKFLGTSAQLAAKPNPRVEKQLAFLKIKANFQILLDKWENELKKEVYSPELSQEISEKLDNCEKFFFQAFSDLNSSIILADKPDNLIMLYGVRFFDLRLKALKKLPELVDPWQKICSELRTFLQKNISFANLRLKKLEERITQIHAKITQGIAKTMSPALISGLQSYLKIYTETVRLEMSTVKFVTEEDWQKVKPQISMKLNELEETILPLKDKIPLEIKKDLRNFLLLNEELLRMFLRMYYLKNLQTGIEDDNFASFAETLGIIRRNSSSLYLYRADTITYREIRYFLDQHLSVGKKALIYANAKVFSGVSVYNLPENNYLTGDIKIELQNYTDQIKVTISGVLLNENDGLNRVKFSFYFSDPDDASKFIISGFQRYDFLERLPAVNFF